MCAEGQRCPPGVRGAQLLLRAGFPGLHSSAFDRGFRFERPAPAVRAIGKSAVHIFGADDS